PVEAAPADDLGYAVLAAVDVPVMAGDAAVAVAAVVFNNMAAPTSDADRAAVVTNATIDITYTDGSKKTAPKDDDVAPDDIPF
ncbi:hypothetical protein EBT31_10960, partial [bacterium]|nr:hypothetical protein [bacterium]